MNEFDLIKNAYDAVALKYKEKRETQGPWNNFLEAPAMAKLLSPKVKGKKVLDLGCGTGILTKEILDWGGEVRGIDFSQGMLDLARSDLPSIIFDLGNINKLPYKDGQFDVVASSLVLHYIQDLTPIFSEVARVLKPQGSFVFSMHHPVQEIFKRNKEKQDERPTMQPYFHNEAYFWSMCGQEFISFHHTFESLIQGMNSQGLCLDNLIECRPAPECQEQFPDYTFTSLYPSFCVFSVFKRG